jgi:TPR repeat protein
LCLIEGEGVPIDWNTAAQYFKLAAVQGNAAAQFSDGLCLMKGEGVPID